MLRRYQKGDLVVDLIHRIHAVVMDVHNAPHGQTLQLGENVPAYPCCRWRDDNQVAPAND